MLLEDGLDDGRGGCALHIADAGAGAAWIAATICVLWMKTGSYSTMSLEPDMVMLLIPSRPVKAWEQLLLVHRRSEPLEGELGIDVLMRSRVG